MIVDCWIDLDDERKLKDLQEENDRLKEKVHALEEKLKRSQETGELMKDHIQILLDQLREANNNNNNNNK